MMVRALPLEAAPLESETGPMTKGLSTVPLENFWLGWASQVFPAGSLTPTWELGTLGLAYQVAPGVLGVTRGEQRTPRTTAG